MSKRVVVDGMGNEVNNEIMEEKVMNENEVIKMVMEFVEGMDNKGKREFLKKLGVEVKESMEDEGGRKKEVRELLEESGSEGISIKEIGERLNMSNKNVSSVLSYLRKDGLRLMTRSDGRKVIER